MIRPFLPVGLGENGVFRADVGGDDFSATPGEGVEIGKTNG